MNSPNDTAAPLTTIDPRPQEQQRRRQQQQQQPSQQKQQADVVKTSDGLVAGSYTATQLQHATAEHMHITSRRCFIGPIPEAWLSKHRKSWYHYRPSFARYSSRTASFLAAANVANVRNVSGLEGATGTIRHSFPQPLDLIPTEESRPPSAVEEEEGDEEEEGTDDARLRPLAPERTTTATNDPSAKTVQTVPIPTRQSSLAKSQSSTRPESTASGRIKHGKTGSASSSFWWKRANAKESRPSFLRKVSGKSAGSSSFVTAAETLDDEHADSEFQALDREGNEVGPKTSPVAEESEMSPRNSSVASPQTSRNPGSVKSTAPLLANAGAAGGTSVAPDSAGGSDLAGPSAAIAFDPSSRPKSALKRPNTSQRKGDVKTDRSGQNSESTRMKSLKPLAPTATNLVRFNEPDTKHLRIDDTAAQGELQKRSLKTNLRRRPTARAGQLLKAERMLVRVDSTVHNLGNDFDENLYFAKEAKPVNKWREFVIVCRQVDDPDADFVLRMYKSRVVPLLEDKKTSKKFLHEIVLRKKDVHVNLFSSLDKTIVIWAPFKKFTRIYILKPQSSSDAVQWYHFLRSCLGWRRPPQLSVHVPDLDVTLTLDNPFRSRGSPVDRKGDEVDKEFESEVEDDGGVARTIILKCLELLSQSSLSNTTDIWREHGDRLGLAWRRYDRLEWISGVNEENMYGTLAMQASHELEMLPKQHYPTTSKKHGPNSKSLEEPPAVEGFLVRMTSQKGRHKRAGKNFYKKLYFYTQNQLLCFCQPSKAMPPKPPVIACKANNDDNTPNTKEIADQIPLIFGVNPYPLNDGRISWLDKSDEEKVQLDQRAYEEAERRTNVLLETEAYIDLTHVVKVRKVKGDAVPEEEEQQRGAELDEDEELVGEEADESDHEEAVEDESDVEARSFVLMLKNGLSVRLQAYSVTARKEWVKRLRGLIKYWRARRSEDSRLLQQIRRENLTRLQVDEEMEAIVGQYARKWEVKRSVASGQIWNMCGIACCRSLTLHGTLYRKPRLHGTFTRCDVLLAHGRLLIFQNALRQVSGQQQAHAHAERQEVVELEDAYVYSGLITDGDLLYQNQTFSPEHPGHSATPRIYIQDGNWTSSDEDTMTCFCLWRARRRSLFRGIRASDDGSVRSKLRYVSSLGVPGRTMVFKTRSRAERDRWVLAIGLEIERLRRGQAARESDIRITGKVEDEVAKS